VQAELDWEPGLREHEIGLAVKNGVVTLWGQVCHPDQQKLAEEATKRVGGIEVVVNRLGVRPTGRACATEYATDGT
jgi:osmotically-inducible protein OsmY